MAKPTNASTKQEIMDYLDSKGIHYDPSATKQELLALVV
ncbi:hypothetical protein [Streptococcus constellatus]|nr:hypothetical protein [Streptococcus constellatus]DAV77290.1 MAG TPA: Thymopoietin protein [Caudoviricetes sp.]